MDRIDPILNRRITEVRPLVSPRTVRGAAPLSEANENLVRASRKEVSDILNGRDDCVLVVVGPCSVHDPKRSARVAERLQGMAGELHEHLVVMMPRLLRENDVRRSDGKVSSTTRDSTAATMWTRDS